MADCFLVLLFVGMSWTSASSSPRACAFCTDLVGAAVRSRIWLGSSSGSAMPGSSPVFVRSDSGREAAGRAVASAGGGLSHDHGMVANQTVTAAVAVSATLSVILRSSPVR